jgi:hypothetical protein
MKVDVFIDKLTNSIENVITGEVFDTLVLKISNINEIKKSNWQFNWHNEILDSTKDVYKLTTVNNDKIIHGLISIEDKRDLIFMHLIESAKFNRGKDKMYFGIPGNLIAFACKISFEKGYQGFLIFDAKTSLIKHYQMSLNAKIFRGNRMYIETKDALKLITKYFNS